VNLFKLKLNTFATLAFRTMFLNSVNATNALAVDVYLYVRQSHAGIVSKRLNTVSRKQRHTISNGL